MTQGWAIREWVVALAGRAGNTARQGYAVRIEFDGYHEFWGWSASRAVAQGRLTRAAQSMGVRVAGVVPMSFSDHRAHLGYRCSAGNCPTVDPEGGAR